MSAIAGAAINAKTKSTQKYFTNFKMRLLFERDVGFDFANIQRLPRLRLVNEFGLADDINHCLR
jgi:hypothetical protein